MLEVLLAATLVLPTVDQRAPRHLLHGLRMDSEDGPAAARTALWIDSKGKVRDCKLIGFAGSEELAKLMCEKIVGARFLPARDGAGEKRHSLFTTVLGATGESVHRSGTMMNWLRGPSAPADFIVGVEELPAGLKWDPRVQINLLIDDAGKVIVCEGTEAGREQWSEIACSQAINATFEQRRSREDEPVSYIRNIVVKFQEGD